MIPSSPEQASLQLASSNASVNDVEKYEFEPIKGYLVPEDAGTIRVKITDLLSESWEGSVVNG